jgi:hypothetical protein
MSTEVEMTNVEDGPGAVHENTTNHPNELSEKDRHVIQNGHVSNGELSQSPNGTAPLPSIEKDAESSSSPQTADGRVNSPKAEVRVKIASSPIGSRRDGHSKHSSQQPPAHVTPESIKLDKEVARLKELLAETSPEAAQKVLKDKWRVFLFDGYDEDHISFILRAGLKNSNLPILERVLKDDSAFKEPFAVMASKKPNVIAKVLKSATHTQLSSNVPVRTLDRVIVEHLKHVPARTLIRWMAEADRLGYKIDDILDEQDESVIPNVPSRPQSRDSSEVFEVVGPQPHLDLAQPFRDPLLAEQEKNAAAAQHLAMLKTAKNNEVIAQARTVAASGPFICPRCKANIPTFSGYNYHTTKKVCTKDEPSDGWKWKCPNCVQGFTQKGGLDYHSGKNVCRNENIVPTTSPSAAQLQHEARAAYPQQPQQPQQHPPPILPPQRPQFTPRPVQQPPPSYPPQLPPGTALHAPQYPPQGPPQFPQPPFSQPPPNPQYQRQPNPSSQIPPSQPSAAQPPPSIPRPPFIPPASTPRGPSKLPDDVRQSPSELPPEKRAAMDKEIQDADDKYEQQIAAIPKDYTEEQRQARMISLKNGVASKKSQIRKSYGVTLRMRERDKQARKSAGMSTPPTNPRLEEYRAQPPPRPNSAGPVNGTPTSTPPVSGFSPINGTNSNAPTPPTATTNYGSGSPKPQAPWGSDISLGQYKSQYRPPPINAAQRVQNSFTIPHPNTLTHALESQPAPGYGVLRPNNPPQQLTPSNYQQVTSNKRRRTSEDVGDAEPRGVTNGERDQSGLAMLPVRIEDAASKFPRKNPLLPGQRREDGRGVSGGDVPMTEAGSSTAVPAPAPAPVRRGSKEVAITIISSSSESEGEGNGKRGGGEGAGSANL